MIDLHYWPTPNGWKISIMLEEAGLDYRMIPCDINRGDQFKPAFLRISPNNRMPAIVDHDVDGEPVSVFESGAILLYLAEKSGRFLPPPSSCTEMFEWLFWQVGNLGPMGGQVGHFVNYAPADQTYGRDRYRNEYHRCLGVLDRRLEQRRYVLGDTYTIVDMACWPWALLNRFFDTSLDDFPHLQRWRSEIKQRPAVRRGVDVGRELRRRTPPNEAERRHLFGQTGRR